jgi:hypothetical protein
MCIPRDCCPLNEAYAGLGLRSARVLIRRLTAGRAPGGVGRGAKKGGLAWEGSDRVGGVRGGVSVGAVRDRCE